MTPTDARTSSAAQGRAEGAQRLADGEQAARGAAEPTRENLARSTVGSSPDAGTAATPLRIAYADPPYPGCAHLYAEHPDYGGEVDHAELIERLVSGYEGWALSTSSKALRAILGMCPAGVRVLVWVKNTVRYAWEPVIVQPARDPDPGRGHLRDWIHCEAEAFQWRPKPDSYVIGQKPGPFCHWLFEWLGADPSDEFHDLFPGSGAVGRAWQEFATQGRLVPREAPNLRSIKRARVKALSQHPTLEAEEGPHVSRWDA